VLVGKTAIPPCSTGRPAGAATEVEAAVPTLPLLRTLHTPGARTWRIHDDGGCDGDNLGSDIAGGNALTRTRGGIRTRPRPTLPGHIGVGLDWSSRRSRNLQSRGGGARSEELGEGDTIRIGGRSDTAGGSGGSAQRLLGRGGGSEGGGPPAYLADRHRRYSAHLRR